MTLTSLLIRSARSPVFWLGLLLASSIPRGEAVGDLTGRYWTYGWPFEPQELKVGNMGHTTDPPNWSGWLPLSYEIKAGRIEGVFWRLDWWNLGLSTAFWAMIFLALTGLRLALQPKRFGIALWWVIVAIVVYSFSYPLAMVRGLPAARDGVQEFGSTFRFGDALDEFSPNPPLQGKVTVWNYFYYPLDMLSGCSAYRQTAESW